MSDGIHEGNPVCGNVFWNDKQVKERERAAVWEFAKRMAEECHIGALFAETKMTTTTNFAAGEKAAFEQMKERIRAAAEEWGK
ncbi:MAG: hypothetical protein C4523_02360 [Myxococcales bacterium]|nr:MAG: hypothetical protein C4523_02360 [Myxococcales bacterium]